MPYPSLLLLSDVIRLLGFSMVALDRSTVLMALLAHRSAKERRRTRDRRTNEDEETKDPERKEPRQKNEGALFYRCERTRRIAGRRGKTERVCWGWKEPRAPREGAWRGVVKFVEGWFLLDLYFINYVLESRTPKTRIRTRVALSSFISTKNEIFNGPPPAIEVIIARFIVHISTQWNCFYQILMIYRTLGTNVGFNCANLW